MENNAPTQAQFEENVGSIMEEVRYIREQFEEVWMAMRAKSFGVMDKRVKRYDTLSEGDLVYTWIPKLLQRKLGSRWEGPHRVDKVLNDQVGNRVLVNGKMEHAFNLKRGLKREPAINNTDGRGAKNDTLQEIEPTEIPLIENSNDQGVTESGNEIGDVNSAIEPASFSEPSSPNLQSHLAKEIDANAQPDRAEEMDLRDELDIPSGSVDNFPENLENLSSPELRLAMESDNRRGEKRKLRDSAKEALKRIRAAMAILCWDKPGGELLIF